MSESTEGADARTAATTGWTGIVLGVLSWAVVLWSAVDRRSGLNGAFDKIGAFIVVTPLSVVSLGAGLISLKEVPDNRLGLIAVTLSVSAFAILVASV